MRLSKGEGKTLVRNVIELGINFIDTANAYGDSEEKIGEAIQEIPRESLVIATKSMARDKKSFLEHLHTSLKRLKTDYIDIFQMHSVSSDDTMNKVMGPGGALEGLEQAITQGKVRHPAFSSHNLTVSKKLMLTGKFHAFQVPFNFIDDEAAEEIIPLSRELDLGMIAMKPLGGGLLDEASLCFRYLMQFDGIVPDPGIEHVEEMKEIIDIVQNLSPLREDEKARMEQIKRKMGGSWCHRCEYCQPCPQGIPISLVLVSESIAKRMPYDSAASFLKEAMQKAKNCTECRECVERCPYDLNIPELLEKRISSWKNYLQTKTWIL